LKWGAKPQRNALREIEINLPLSFLAMGGESVDGWIALLGLTWSGIFLLFPLFNKDRLRAGDLIAGTWVVRAPKPILANDLASEKADLDNAFTFTPELIRANETQTVMDVSDRIRNKIKWQKGLSENDLDFLKAFYASLRGRLETRLLFGVRRKDKFDKT